MTLNYGNYGIVLIMGNAVFKSSTVSRRPCKPAQEAPGRGYPPKKQNNLTGVGTPCGLLQARKVRKGVLHKVRLTLRRPSLEKSLRSPLPPVQKTPKVKRPPYRDLRAQIDSCIRMYMGPEEFARMEARGKIWLMDKILHDP